MNHLFCLALLAVPLFAKITVYKSISDAFELKSAGPLIGIFTLPLSKTLQQKVFDALSKEPVLDPDADLLNEIERMTFFPGSYAKWVEEEGVHVVPIDYSLDDAQLQAALDSVNGLLLTGGTTSLYKPDKKISIEGDTSRVFKVKEPSAYTLKVRALLEKAKRLNDEGQHFPVWATCLGYEAMVLSESDLEAPLHKVLNLNTNQPLIFPEDHQKHLDTGVNDVLDGFNPEELSNLSKERLVFFNHENAFLPESFENIPALRDNFKVIALSKAKSPTFTKPFVAMIESTKYPIVGVQFHPEKTKFELLGRTHANHSEKARHLSDMFSKFLASNALLNAEQLEKERELKEGTRIEILKTPPLGVFDEVYLFRRTRRRSVL